MKSNGGRNFLGRVCIKGRGSCNSSEKRIYRYIDFYRRINKKGLLLKIFYTITFIIFRLRVSCMVEHLLKVMAMVLCPLVLNQLALETVSKMDQMQSAFAESSRRPSRARVPSPHPTAHPSRRASRPAASCLGRRGRLRWRRIFAQI